MGRNWNTLILSSWIVLIPDKPKLVSIIFLGDFVENKLPIDIKECEETAIIVHNNPCKRKDATQVDSKWLSYIYIYIYLTDISKTLFKLNLFISDFFLIKILLYMLRKEWGY